MLVKQMLELDEFAVFSSCEHWLRTVPTLDPNPDNPDDWDDAGEDHMADMTKAALMRRTSNPEGLASDDTPDPETVTGTEVLPDGTHRIARGAERPR